MNNNKKNTERNTILISVTMIAIIIVGSIVLNYLKSPEYRANNNPITDDENQNGKPGTLIDGTYTAQSPQPYNGYTGVVTIQVTNGNIYSLVHDAMNEQGELKSHLSSVGEYVMVEGNPTWKEQAQLLAEYVIEHQSVDGLVMDDEGKTDAISGVSINISEFVNLVHNCLEQASSTKQSALVDGTYTSESPQPYNGYTGIVTMKVAKGNIVSLVYDAANELGELKSHLSSVGEYVMVEGNPTWQEQAQLLAEYVIENQSLNALVMNDEGKTDAVTGVSINIAEFVNLTQNCLEQAAKGNTK